MSSLLFSALVGSRFGPSMAMHLVKHRTTIRRSLTTSTTIPGNATQALDSKNQPPTEAVDLTKAMEKFRSEREQKLRTTLRVLERIKVKESKGIPARRLETLFSELVATSPLSLAALQPNAVESRKAGENSIDQEMETILSVRQPVDRMFRKTNKHRLKHQDKLTQTNVQLVQYFERTDTFKVQIVVPAQCVPKLIGSRAWRVRKLALDSSCIVSIIGTPEDGSGRPFAQLVGNESQIREAYELLTSTINTITNFENNVGHDKEFNLTTAMSVSMEDLVRDLKRISGAFIRAVDKSVVHVWGTTKQVDIVTRMVEELRDERILHLTVVPNQAGDMNPTQFLEKVPAYLIKMHVRIPSHLIPVLMGSNMATVRRMKAETRADIKYFQDDDQIGGTAILFGSYEQVLAAKFHIDSFVEEHRKFTNNVDWKKQVALKDRREMQVLIGKNFSGIRKLQQVTGCFVRVSDPKDPSLTVRLWGRPDQVEHAIKSMFAVVKYGSASIT